MITRTSNVADPPLATEPGPMTISMSWVGREVTARVRDADLVRGPAVPVTVTVYVPVGVLDAVVMVRELDVPDMVGVMDTRLKEQEAPVGMPEQERLTI